MKLYHGCLYKIGSRAHIEGIHPRGEYESNWEIGSRSDEVYLTTAYAMYFGLNASLRAQSKRFTVVEVDLDKLSKRKLYPDEDFLEQASREDKRFYFAGTDMVERTKYFREHKDDFRSNWRNSIKHLGCCSYRGVIPVGSVTKVVSVNFGLNRDLVGIASDAMVHLTNFKFCSHKYVALTRWLMGEPIDVLSDILLYGYSREQDVTQDIRSCYGEQLQMWEKLIAERKGIKVLYDRGGE